MKVILSLTALLASSVYAIDNQSTVCSFGENTRKIELVYPNQTELPCEVHYTKGEETKVLWKASGETGFCEAKYASFVEKQVSWGFSCKDMSTKAESAPEPEASSEPEAEETSSEEKDS
ncbi:hypothetical protein [Pleionea litopenaei]|uniref:SH3 domain-containing protein n=1 Tax=Pleionea litopenaei TaxID=3070815 RepID=A0AA51RT05_9GAMM|nr:hypothetical protein [Pleionea sp. HL-JVS1]WMS87045.1 hypothetical protein Q9312_17695 [Pleionea sp. HL-JVS1]